MNKLTAYISILFLLAIGSCIDPIPFSAQNTSRVVIFGSITQEDRIHTVNIARSNRFGGFPLPLKGATVRVVGSDGSEGLYEEGEEGEYLLYPNRFRVLIGQEYHIEVELPNGQAYRSEPERVPVPRSLDDVYFQATFREEVSNANVILESAKIEIYVNTPTKTNGQQTYLRWDVEEDWDFTDFVCGGLDRSATCYFDAFTRTVRMPLFHSEDESQERIDGFKVFERSPFPTIEFNFRHYFSVRQYSISERAYRFWEQVNLVSNPQGTIFDVLPAAVEGNIYNVETEDEIVLGYFEASASSIGRTFTQPDLLEPIFIELECNPFLPFNVDNFQICCFCTSIPGATLERPEWWGE